MDANVWGPHSWFFLHSITFGYPNLTESQKKSYYDFINGLHTHCLVKNAEIILNKNYLKCLYILI